MIVFIEIIDAANLAGPPASAESVFNACLEAAGLTGTRRALITMSRKAHGGALFSGTMGITLRIEYQTLIDWHASMIKDFVMPLLSSGETVALFVVTSPGTETQASAIAGVVRSYAGIPASVTAQGEKPDADTVALLIATFNRRTAARTMPGSGSGGKIR